MTLNPEHGGIKAPNVKEIISSQKLRWISRLQNSNIKWCSVILNRINSHLLWLSDGNFIKEKIVPQITNAF